MDKGSTLEARLIEEMSATIGGIDTKIGENTDTVGITTLFARFRQIVDSYLADATIGLANLKALIDANQVDLNAIIVDTTSIETKVDVIQADLDNATDGLGALNALIDANQVDLNAIIVDTTSIESKVDTVDTVVDGIQTDLSNATDGLGALKDLIDTNQVDLNSILVGTGNIETKVDANQTDLDAILADTETLLHKATKTITLGTGAVPVTETLFTVTGEVEAYIVGYIDAAVTSGGALTLEVGITGATAGLIAQTAVGNLLIDLLWVDATPAVLVSKPSEKIIANSADISHIIKTADATAGAITYTCFWRPLSDDGDIVAA